jgi:adenylate cyclase
VAEERVQRRLAAILAADVVGYSRLMGADEAGTVSRLKALQDEIFRPKVDEYGGRIVKLMGDGVLIEFPSAVDAVQHAIDVQQAVTDLNGSVPPEQHIELRMGINLGDVIVDGDDIYGDGVNVAARLEAFSEPGKICVSTMVREGVRGKLDISFDDLGEQSLKNIAEPVRIFCITPVVERADSETAGISNALLRRPAIAVLPFQNLSGDPDQEYFADGLTEDIITALSSWRSFPVIARNSSFAYKGTSPDVRQVGKELGARYVIEGSIQKAANRVRVTAQLINAETGHHVWAERFDRELQDIFELQDEITGKIAAVVSPELVKAESERSASKRPENLDAWDYCQRGKFLMNEISKSGVKDARDLFERAVAIDPNFTDAWCGIGNTYHRELFSGWSDNPDEAKIKLLEAARRAVALDDGNADAHHCLSFGYMNNGQSAEAVAAAERAVDLSPINPQSHNRLGGVLALAGRPEDGVPVMQAGLRLNPRHPRIHLHRALLARAHLDAHQYEEAADQARQVIQRGRVYLDEHLTLASALGHLGRADEARNTRIFGSARSCFAPGGSSIRNPAPTSICSMACAKPA